LIEVFSHSEAGGHVENQDAFLVQPHPLDPKAYLCVVADGQGGRSGAAAAAKLACKVAMETAGEHAPSQLLLRPNLWTQVLETADRAVADDPVSGFTTLVGFCISDSHLCGASCGDSAALLLRPNERGTILTARQQKDPPVGSGAAVFVSFVAKLLPPWKVLAMTDGVWKYVGWDDVLKIAAEGHGQDLLTALRNRAGLPRTGKLQDDFTVVLLQSATQR
jgi:serine/threonine protein phosphatase PrpC